MIHRLKNLGMVVTPSFRTKAYIQKLTRAGLLPRHVILKLKETGQEVDRSCGERDKILPFNPLESEVHTLEQYGISYGIVRADSFNSEPVIAALRARPEEYFVYSGGDILKKEIIEVGKQLIHVHPGRLPDYRGSTCFHYMALAENRCAASSFIMQRGLDVGDVLAMQEFDPPKDIDIFRVYDPHIRSEVLIQVVKQLIETGTLKGKPQTKEGGRDYYVIHPVLEHLALLKANGEPSDG